MTVRDPRNIITPDAFEVAEDLLDHGHTRLQVGLATIFEQVHSGCYYHPIL